MFAGSIYRSGLYPAHGSVDVATDGMFTYSRTATTDRWADDPASFGSDEFSVVVRADGRDLAEIVVRPLLSTNARMPITSVRVEVVGGADADGVVGAAATFAAETARLLGATPGDGDGDAGPQMGC
jgi:hypothetical protein